MNIIIDYNKDDYAFDALKVADTKSNLIYSNSIKRVAFFSIIPFAIFLGGVKSNHNLFYEILASGGLAVFLFMIFYLVLLVLAKKTPRQEAREKIARFDEITFFFDDNRFAYRDKMVYHEYNWNYFSSYLVIGGFVFLISKKFNTSFFVSQKQFYKQQFEELNTFLATKLPVETRLNFY